MSFLNRAVIPAANGITVLSIPIVGGRETKQVLREVRIDNSQDWQTRHWRTISSAYRRSPWFEFYEPGLKPLYETQFELLNEWNIALMKWILKSLQADPDVKTREFSESAHPTWEVENGLKPSTFQDQRFVRILPVYPQVFQDRIGFQPNVSIIDLIFNEGNKSRSLLLNTSS